MRRRNDGKSRCLIITVAGMATRFRKSVGHDCLKCLYFEHDFAESILSRLILAVQEEFDRIIVVGGYRYQQLQAAIALYFKGIQDKICLIQNIHYEDFGSGYSLLLGIHEACLWNVSEIVFAEGDLYVRPEAFQTMCSMDGNIICTNGKTIKASESVAFYLDKNNRIHYIYDTEHGTLEIKEPFREIHNSGQIWKFVDTLRLYKICEQLTEAEKRGTNLVIIQKYFNTAAQGDYQIFHFNDWLNCNTVEDYHRIAELERQQDEKYG